MPLQSVPPRASLARYAAASVALWAIAVLAAFWYLRRITAGDARAASLTGPDSIGLPLAAFAVWLAITLLVVNVAAVIVVRWRRHMRG
jgi:hypothetical protein